MSERPIECSQCKRPIKVVYKEITSHAITCFEMCADCPVFQGRLHGDHSASEKEAHPICCSNCDTSIESVKLGDPLGCAECFVVFADFLIKELIATGGVPSALQKKLTNGSPKAIHVGKTPDQPYSISLSSQMTSLNEALNEALKRENYEQAAWLRDQIKALRENKP